MEKLTHPGIPSLKPKGRRLQPETNSHLNSLPGKGKEATIKATRAFTLVELIVVITILAILGMIAFISLQGYSKNSRESVRIADINTIEKSLGLFVIQSGFYPVPDNPKEITYSGGTAWVQGTIGDTVIKNIGKLNKKPVDPLTSNEYVYSVTTSKREYEIGTISEGGELTHLQINKTNAENSNDKQAVVKGTYNKRILKVSTGGINYILAIPSIIATDTSDLILENIIKQKKLVYDKYTNLPYNSEGKTQTGGFNFETNKLEIYSGSTIDIKDDDEKIIFFTNLKEAYKGTILEQEETYKEIINIDSIVEQDNALDLVNKYIMNNLGGISGKVISVKYNNCVLDGQEVKHKEKITAYSEKVIRYSSNYSCIDKVKEITCNDGKFDGEEIYKYSSCVKGEPTNCPANSNYIYNGHIYSISAINHGETVTNINSQIINLPHGTQIYKLSSLGCNDGELVNEIEEENPEVVCDRLYVGTDCNILLEPGNDSNTLVLVHSDTADLDTTIVNSAVGSNLSVTNTSVTHSTNYPHFGTTSLNFSSGIKYLSLPSISSLGISNSDFTIDFWMYPINIPGSDVEWLISDFNHQNGRAWSSFHIGYLPTKKLSVCVSAVCINPVSTLGLNNWHHIALVKVGDKIKLFTNGIYEGEATVGYTINNVTLPIRAGLSNYAGGVYEGFVYNGYMDEIRISNVARWTGSGCVVGQKCFYLYNFPYFSN